MSAKHTPILGAPGYFATEDGRIWSASNWRGNSIRELTPVENGHGYLKVRLLIGGRRRNVPVHRIIATAFVGPKPSGQHEVCHIDGNRQNNAASNLRWGTRKDNAADRERHGRTSRGVAHSAAIRAGLEASHG